MGKRIGVDVHVQAEENSRRDTVQGFGPTNSARAPNLLPKYIYRLFIDVRLEHLKILAIFKFCVLFAENPCKHLTRFHARFDYAAVLVPVCWRILTNTLRVCEKEAKPIQVDY